MKTTKLNLLGAKLMSKALSREKVLAQKEQRFLQKVDELQSKIADCESTHQLIP